MPPHPTTIFINGIESLTTGQLIVETSWQQTGKTNDLGGLLAKAINDPTDQIDIALHQYVSSHGLPLPTYKPFHPLSFSAESGVSGNIWHHGTEYSPVVKGMPERILELCDMSDNERESIMIQLHAMSATGNIIIALATGLVTYPVKDTEHLKHNDKLAFVGFISLRATLLPEAKRLTTNTDASIYLATGQHPAATQAIAKQLGLANSPHVVYDARRLDVMNSGEIAAVVASVKIFARATPEHKDHIFSTLKAHDKSAIHVKTLADLQKLLAN